MPTKEKDDGIAHVVSISESPRRDPPPLGETKEERKGKTDKKTKKGKKKKKAPLTRGREVKLSRERRRKPGDSIYSTQSKLSKKMAREGLPQGSSVPSPPRLSNRKPTPTRSLAREKSPETKEKESDQKESNPKNNDTDLEKARKSKSKSKKRQRSTKSRKGTKKARKSRSPSRRSRRSRSRFRHVKREVESSSSSRTRSVSSSSTEDSAIPHLADAMFESLEGRSKFSNTSRTQFHRTAKLFVSAGFTSWKTISKLDDETRKFLREDLRANGCKASELSVANDIFAHYETEKDRAKTVSSCETKGVKFEEIVIPNQMKRWTADLSKLSAFLIPDQEMTNVFSKEFAEASKKDPPFIPFVLPKLSEKPWMVPLQSHERAAKYWRENIQHKKTKDDPQQTSLQAWFLYTLRFIFTGDLSDAWSAFGGLSSQLSHLSIVLHLATTETASYAISYDLELRNMIARLARRRDAGCDFSKLLCEENEEIKRYLKVDLGKGRNNSGIVPDPKRTPRPPKAGRFPRPDFPSQASWQPPPPRWNPRPWTPSQPPPKAQPGAHTKGKGKHR